MRRFARAALALAVLQLPGSADGPGSWVAHASLSLARQEVGAARIGDRVFVTGGLLASGGFPLVATATVEAYDIALDSWAFVASMPVALDHMATAASGGKLYVMGGFSADFAPRDELWIYDPLLDTWSSGADLPEARGAAWSVPHGDRIYLFGGAGPAGTVATTFIYHPGADIWTTGADMPTPREHLGAASLGDFIYVIGGRAGAATPVNERYEPATDEWLVLSPMPTLRSAMGVAAFCGRVWAFGGEVPVLSAVTESYDPLTAAWSVHADMPVPRHGAAAVALDDRVLMAAGGAVQGLLPVTHVDAFVPVACPGVVAYCSGTSGCPCTNAGAVGEGCANSSGSGAVLAASGSTSASLDDLVLEVSGITPGEPGLVYMGGGFVAFAFGDGLRCVGGGATGLFRYPVQIASAAGGFSQGPGSSAFSLTAFGPLGTLAACSTWNFQGWYRDGAGPCGSSFNLTNGLTVTFGP